MAGVTAISRPNMVIFVAIDLKVYQSVMLLCAALIGLGEEKATVFGY